MSNLLNDNMIFDRDLNHSRDIHNYSNGNYTYKRKTTNNITYITKDAYIIWFGYYPMNEKFIQRKLQIQNKIHETDKTNNLHHFINKNDITKIIENNINNFKSNNLKLINNDLYNIISMMIKNKKDDNLKDDNLKDDNLKDDDDEREMKYDNKQLNLAFVTYFYGSINNVSYIIPEIPSMKYNCYYFTNNKNMMEKLKNTKWISIFDNNITNDDLIESSMVSKHLKTMPQDFKILRKYDFICSYDNKLELYENAIENLINNELIKNNYAIALREHKFVQNNVWCEFALSMLHERYRKESEKIKNYIYKQLSNGLNETTKFHYENNIIIRNMKHPKMIEFNEVWYSHIKECGIECQISLFFVKQLFPDNFIFTIR